MLVLCSIKGKQLILGVEQAPSGYSRVTLKLLNVLNNLVKLTN